ncbi:MAG: hypothetical protein K5656_08405 [Lachnospiraceae bacterium]|nr:hypothetical protein [Lachnospiraceae bacterium]
MIITKRRVLLAYAMTLVMAMSLMAGVVFAPVKKAKAFDASGRIIDRNWDAFLSTSDSSVAWEDAERQFADENPEWNTYRGEICGETGGSILTYYYHFYSEDGNEYDGIKPWVKAFNEEEWRPTDEAISSTYTVGDKVAAVDSTTDEGGKRHFVFPVTITPGSKVEQFAIGFTNTWEEDGVQKSDDCILAKVVLKERDDLWVKSNINNLSDEVGEALYQAPKDGNTYIGKVYYYSSTLLYPNVSYKQVLDQNRGDWRSTEPWRWTYRGIYDDEGKPMGSHIFVQYYHLNQWGTVLTEDGKYPVSYLVYDEFPEDQTLGATPADFNNIRNSRGFVDSCKWTDIQGDGSEILSPGEYYANVKRTFNGDYYAVWGSYGTVTINGNVTLDISLDRGLRTEEKDDQRVYVESKTYNEWDVTDNTLFHKYTEESYRFVPLEELYPNDKETAKSKRLYQDEFFSTDLLSAPLDRSSYQNASLTVNGNVSFVSLSDLYEGSFSVAAGNYVDGMGVIKYKDTVYRPDEADFEYYGTYVGDGNNIISGGKFIDSIKPLSEEENIDHYVYGASETATKDDVDNFVGYTVIRGGKQGNEDVTGTSTAVVTAGDSGNTPNAIRVDVSNSVGNGVCPMIRPKKANDGSWKDPNAWWDAIKESLNIDKATIMDISLVQDNTKIVEPRSSVNIYIRGIDGWNGKGALYHVREDGTIEKIADNVADGFTSAATDSFSTYFIAENTDVPKAANAKLASLAAAQKKGDSANASTTKKAQTIKATPAKKTFKVKALKKKAATFSIKVTGNKGKVTYKSANKKVAVKNGKVTVKKGTKKGTYKVTVTAAATGDYKKSNTVTIKVVVK